MADRIHASEGLMSEMDNKASVEDTAPSDEVYTADIPAPAADAERDEAADAHAALQEAADYSLAFLDQNVIDCRTRLARLQYRRDTEIISDRKQRSKMDSDIERYKRELAEAEQRRDAVVRGINNAHAKIDAPETEQLPDENEVMASQTAPQTRAPLSQRAHSRAEAYIVARNEKLAEIESEAYLLHARTYRDTIQRLAGTGVSTEEAERQARLDAQNAQDRYLESIGMLAVQQAPLQRAVDGFIRFARRHHILGALFEPDTTAESTDTEHDNDGMPISDDQPPHTVPVVSTASAPENAKPITSEPILAFASTLGETVAPVQDSAADAAPQAETVTNDQRQERYLATMGPRAWYFRELRRRATPKSFEDPAFIGEIWAQAHTLAQQYANGEQVDATLRTYIPAWGEEYEKAVDTILAAKAQELSECATDETRAGVEQKYAGDAVFRQAIEDADKQLQRQQQLDPVWLANIARAIKAAEVDEAPAWIMSVFEDILSRRVADGGPHPAVARRLGTVYKSMLRRYDSAANQGLVRDAGFKVYEAAMAVQTGELLLTDASIPPTLHQRTASSYRHEPTMGEQTKLRAGRWMSRAPRAIGALAAHVVSLEEENHKHRSDGRLAVLTAAAGLQEIAYNRLVDIALAQKAELEAELARNQQRIEDEFDESQRWAEWRRSHESLNAGRTAAQIVDEYHGHIHVARIYRNAQRADHDVLVANMLSWFDEEGIRERAAAQAALYARSVQEIDARLTR